MSKIIYSTEMQKNHLKAAEELTGSDGFMKDAVSIAAYRADDKGKPGDLLCVAVFESFRGGRAEFHLGMSGGKNMNLEIIQALTYISFHPRHFDLDCLLARIPVENVNAICTLLKIGFQIEYRDRGSVAGGGDGIVLSLLRDNVLAAAGPSDKDYRSQMTDQQE
ncbi:hypothetical protein PAF17_16060 [Paracoccus sp. Z330]|uniref:N-acetyltransferase n=1 Tax=Paracoccus onchidii TaxID=3017813 RepID=A0ABT4ZI71_9RHOB|nr:hypothetical protein [Paracoccus onchidii]MDB6179007.1 hypothetical protein [Paracoccus onchidii]